MDNDDILCGINPWRNGVYRGCSSSQHLLNITRTLQQSLMSALDLKPLLAARTVSVEGPIRVDNVDHHVRATSEMIVPIQTVIEEAEEESPNPNSGYLEKRLKICGHCRKIRQDGEFEEGIAGESEVEEEGFEEDEYCEEEDQEAEEEIDEDEEDCEDEEEDEEEEEEEEEEYTISIIDCTPRMRPCRDPPKVKTCPKCPKRTQTHFRELKQTQQKNDQENGEECNDNEAEKSTENEDTNNDCSQEDSGFDELHQECVHLSKDELAQICNKYKLYGTQSGVNQDTTEVTNVDKDDERKSEKQKNGGSKCETNKEDNNNEEDEKQKETGNNAKCCCEDESYEKSYEDDIDYEKSDEHVVEYFGLERPCKAAPLFIEKAKEQRECPPETPERDYSRYDENISEDDNEDIFFRVNPNYSPIKRGSCERKNNKSSPRDGRKNKKNSSIASRKCEPSPSSSSNALKRNGDVYCEGNSVKGLIHKKRENRSVKVNRNGAKTERDADVSSYFEDACSVPKEERKAAKTPKYGMNARLYTENCNNNNPDGVTEELGDYYEHDDEGNSSTEADARKCVDKRGRGDYTGYCFGKDGGQVYEDADKYDAMKAMENNKYTYKEYNSDTCSEAERFHELIEPGCTSVIAISDCCTSTAKNQLKYQKYGHSCNDTSDGSYFTPSSLVSCESLGRETPHELIAQGSPVIEMVLTSTSPNYFSVDTGDTTQQFGAYDSRESDTGFSLTTINFEHYKRVFESIKQRAFAEDCEEYFEACSPDPKEEIPKSNARGSDKPQVLSGISDTESNVDRKSVTKQGGFLRNILGIIIKSRAKKVQKAGSTIQINSTEIMTEKMAFENKRHFSFGRYKAKSSDKSRTINDHTIMKRKREKKPKLRVGKTFIQSAEDTSLVSAVGVIAEAVGNSTALSAVGNTRKVNKKRKRRLSEDEMEVTKVGYNFNSGRSSTGGNDDNGNKKVDDDDDDESSKVAVLDVGKRDAKKSSGEDKSSPNGMTNNQEMDDLPEKQVNVDDIRRGVIFTAKLEEVSRKDLEISGLRLVNSMQGPSQMKRLDEGEKGMLVCSLSELGQNVDMPVIDVHPHSPSQDDDFNSCGFNTAHEVHGNTSQALVPMDAHTIANIMSDIFIVQEGITKERKKTHAKLNPFHPEFSGNTPKAQDASNDSKLETKEHEGQKLVTTGRKRQARVRTAEGLAKNVRCPKFGLGKAISNSVEVMKALEDNSTIGENSTSTVTLPQCLTDPSAATLPQCLADPSAAKQDLPLQSLILSSFTRSKKKNKPDFSNTFKCLGREVNDNKASTEKIDKHESQLNVTKLAGKNKSANLDPKAPIKHQFLNNTVIKEDRDKSDRKRYPFFKAVKSGSCEKASSGRALKKGKLGSISSTQHLSQEPEMAKNTFKCKSSIQIRALGKGKTLRDVCRKKSTGQINLGAYDNDNQNANCDDDDPENCKPQNLSNVIFPDMQQPLQNICDMVELAGMSETQAMAGHEETSSKIVMESFMLDSPMESEITSNLVSYEHPSFRNSAVCCLDDVHERISPQSDLLIQNGQFDMSRNDSCLITGSEMDSKMAPFDQSSKMQDMQLKNFNRNELSSIQDKSVLSKLEDPKIGVVKYGMDKGEALVQSQHGENAGKLQDFGKGFREKKDTSPATEKLGQREERITRAFWKYANYETGETGSSDKSETVNLGRYAKYNNIDNNNDIFCDGQKQSYTNFGSMLHANDRTGVNQGVQIFFGGSYTPSTLNSHKASEDERYRTGGYGSNMKRYNRELSSEAVYTTARHDVLESKEIAKGEYLENRSPLHRINFGASWASKEGHTNTDYVKPGSTYTEGNAMKPHPKMSEGHSIKLSADYCELKVGKSKDAAPKAGTTYSPAWRISDANKCKTEEPTDSQFWSRNFSSPLSADERIGKMADAILDMKAGKAQDTDCWSDKVYSPVRGAGVAWKGEDSNVETRSDEINRNAGWSDPPRHSPRGEKAWPVNETDVQDIAETAGWGLPMHRPVEANEWNLDGVTKRVTEIKNNESLLFRSGNGEKLAHIIAHGADAAVGNEAFGNKSQLISPRSPSSALRSPQIDGKEYAKGSSGWRDAIGDPAKLRDKQKESFTAGQSSGKSRFGREELVSKYPNRTITDNNRRDKVESEAGRKAKGITSPNVSSRLDAGNRYGYQGNSGQSMQEMVSEGMARKDKQEAFNQARKSASPSNSWSDGPGRHGHGSTSNTGRDVHEEALKHPYSVRQKSANERIRKHANREEKDTGTRRDEVTKEMKGLFNKGDSTSRHGYTVFPNAAQPVTESSPEQSINRRHKSLYEDISSARSRTQSSPTKEIKKSGSGSRIGYTSSAGKHTVDNNGERQNLKGKDSRLKPEKPSSNGMSLGSPRSGEKGVRQGYTTSSSRSKHSGDRRDDQGHADTEGHWKENSRTREFTDSVSPRRSTKPYSGDRDGYVMKSPGGRTKASPNDQEPYLTKDSLSRRDKGNVTRGGQDTTSPRNSTTMSRNEHATNQFNGKKSPQQIAEKQFINHDNSSRKYNIAGEKRSSSPTFNGNKESTWNSDNISKTGKNKAQQSPTFKDSSSKRGKTDGWAESNAAETKVNASNELQIKRGYSANSDKRKDPSYLVELSRIGKEKLAASQRREGGVHSANEPRRKAADTTPNSQTAERTKQGSAKKDKTAGDGSAPRSRNTSPSTTPKGESKSKHSHSIAPTVAKKIQEPKIEQPPGAKESSNRSEKRLDDTMSLAKELKSPRIKPETIRRQSYLSPNSDKNKLSHDAVQRSIAMNVSGNRAEMRAGDPYKVAGNISPSSSMTSEIWSSQNVLKSPISLKTNQLYLTVESGGRNPKETRGGTGHERETSLILNSKVEQMDKHGKVRRTNEHSNATHENDRREKRPSEDWNRRNGTDSKTHRKSEENGRSPPNAGKNSSYHKVDRTGQDNFKTFENNVDDALRHMKEMSPKGYIKKEHLNGRQGFYDGSVKARPITSPRGDQPAAAGETHSWSEKAAVSPVTELNPFRGQLKNELRKGQDDTSQNVSKNTFCHWAPCITVESVDTVETMEETVARGNKLACLDTGGIRGNDEDSLPVGLSMSEHNMEKQLTPMDATDYTGTSPGEMAMKANESVYLNSDQSIHQDLTDFQNDYTIEEVSGHIETDVGSFETNLGDLSTNTKEGYDWRSRPSITEVNNANIKPVQGYIKHQGVSRSRHQLAKTIEPNNSEQSGTGKIDPLMQNNQIIGDYSAVKTDHSPKIASVIEDSIDLARNDNRVTDVGVIMNNKANTDAFSHAKRGDNTGQKIEKQPRAEKEGKQSDYEKRDPDKFRPTSSRQSGANIGNNGGSESSKRSDPSAQLKGINEKRAMQIPGSVDDKRADSHQNHKPTRVFKAEYENKSGDKGRNKATDNSRRQRAAEQGTIDAESLSAQLERKSHSQLSVNGDREERKRAALERFIIRQKLKKSDSKMAFYPSRKVENSKSEVYTTLDNSEKTQSIEQYQQVSSADSKSGGKRWKTEIHRKKLKSEADKISEAEKCDLSSSVDTNWKNSTVSSKYSLHSSERRHGAELTKKHQEGLGWTRNSADVSPENNSRNDRVNTRQSQQIKVGGSGSLLKNSSWRSEQYEASKTTVPRNEATQSATGEKAKRRPITVKKSQTDTNQTDRYSSTMIDSSLVDNVARAWMEDTEKNNGFHLKDKRGSTPSMTRQTSGTVLSTYQSGEKAGKDVRKSPSGNSGDYLDVFPRPTFLNNSKSRKQEEPDPSPVRVVQKGSSHHFAHKQFDEDPFQDGEFTGNKLVTLDRESRRDGIHVSLNPGKQFYSKFEHFAPQTVSLDSRPYLAHLVNNKPRDIRKQLTKDDSFIYQTNNYNDNVWDVDKHAVRNNRLDGVTSEKSYSIRDKRRKEVALHGVPEERAPTKTTQDGPQRGNAQQAQRIIDHKNGKSASESTQATKPKSDSTKEIKPTPKNTKINKKHEASYGTKTTSEHSRNNKASEDASHSKPTQDSARGSKQAEGSGDKKTHSDNQPPRGQMFSYKVSSKGSGSEVVKSTQRAAQPAGKAEKGDTTFMKQNLQVGPITETTPDLLREPVSEIKDETIKREVVSEPAQLGLFARLINTLTRSSKATPQVNNNVPSSESKQEIINKPTECVNEQVKPESGHGTREKVGLSKRNRPIYNRSPATSLRDGKNMRSDYKQNMNGNAHCDMDEEPSPEAFERSGVVIQKWATQREMPYYRVTTTNLPGKKHMSSVSFAVEPEKKHTSSVAFAEEPEKKHMSYVSFAEEPEKKHMSSVSFAVEPEKKHMSSVTFAEEPEKKHTSSVSFAEKPEKKHTSSVAFAEEPGKAHTNFVASAGEATTLKVVLITTLCIGACYPVIWKCCSEFPLPSIYELVYIHCLFSLGIDALLRRNLVAQQHVSNDKAKKYNL